MSTASLIEHLKQVRWSASAGTSVILSEWGISHGFIGISSESPIPDVKPHHVAQVHGNLVISANDLTSFDSIRRPQADGLFSNRPSSLAVKTADCLPILMAGGQGKWVAAIHAGWRGLTAGIILNALKLAQDSCQLSDLRVAIGPAISREHFEVGPEVVAALQNPSCGLSDAAWALTVSKGAEDRWHADLQLAATLQLILAGVHPNQIEVIQGCTFSDKHGESPRWNSYRRDGKAMNSNWAFISRAPFDFVPPKTPRAI